MGIDVSGYSGIRPGFTGLNYATNSGNFLIEVSKGNISGHSAIFKFGRNEEIDTGKTPKIFGLMEDYTLTITHLQFNTFLLPML
jgi:hypothetical protein